MCSSGASIVLWLYDYVRYLKEVQQNGEFYSKAQVGRAAVWRDVHENSEHFFLFYPYGAA